MTTTRFQISRRRGWRKPKGGVICARPSKWGNPFKRNAGENGAPAVRAHRQWLLTHPEGKKIAKAAKAELKGKPLGCWCPLSEPCHVDNLIDAAEGRL